MAFKYYYEYLQPENAPEMPEDKRGDEELDEITQDEQRSRAQFVNIAVLTLTLVLCAMIVFVLRKNDYSRVTDEKTLDKDSFVSGEFFGSLEDDVVSHLALSDQIVRTDDLMSYFCGIGNKLMKSEEEDISSQTGGAFRDRQENSLPGRQERNEGGEHKVVTRVSSDEDDTKQTKKTKKTKSTTTSVTKSVKEMTSTTTQYGYYTTTTTKETEETTTTKATNHNAPSVTTKVTTAPTTTTTKLAPPPAANTSMEDAATMTKTQSQTKSRTQTKTQTQTQTKTQTQTQTQTKSETQPPADTDAVSMTGESTPDGPSPTEQDEPQEPQG